MTEKVTVASFEEDTDPDTLNPIRVQAETRYIGIARIRWGSREVSNSQATGSPAAMQEPYVSVPFGSPRLFTGDEVVCTGSEDPVLVGRRFKIAGAASAGQVTAHRYPAEELS